MTEDLADHLALRDDGDEPQRPALTPRAVHHIQRKRPMQQLCPAPMRRRDRGLLYLQPLLARGGDDAPAQMAVRRQAPPIAHEMDVGQGDQRRQLLQELHRREANACGPVRPRMGEGIDEVPVSLFLEALQRHRTACGIADELSLLGVRSGYMCFSRKGSIYRNNKGLIDAHRIRLMSVSIHCRN
jgi:hypothetical protein